MDIQLTEQQQPSWAGAKLVAGIFFTAIGILMTLENFDVYPAERILSYWPIVLVVIGLMKLRRNGNHTVAVISIVAGLFLLARTVPHLIHFRLLDLWPLALIIAGVAIVMQAIGWKSEPATSDGESNIWAVLTHRKVVGTSRDYSGGQIVAFIGGCQLDLSGAIIESGPAIIEAIAVWGGITICVPPGWEVVSEVMPIMGGIDVKTKAQPAGKQLIVRGFALMGGMQIKTVEARTI